MGISLAKKARLCCVYTEKKERRRRYARTYVCLMGSELVHLRAPLSFFYSPPLLLIWRQSKAIRYWSDGGVVVIVAPALKIKKKIGSEWERGCVSFARLYTVGERKRRNSALIINLFFFFSIQPTPSALNSRKQPTGWKKTKTSR